jgi:cobalt-zinc-cadmium efflux system outer membrane protein
MVTVLTFPSSAVSAEHKTAADAEPRGLSLRQAIENALSKNKQLAAFAYRLAEHDGRVQQADTLPNPRAELLFENLGGQGDFDGFSNAETTLSIAWAIEPGLRGRRVGLARARSEQARLDAEILQLDVASETAQRFLTCLEIQAHLETAGEAVVLAEQIATAIERQVRAGREPRAKVMRALAELATARLDRDDVTHQQSVAYHRLAAQWGETTPSFSRVDAELLSLPTVPSFDDLTARIERNPELARLASEQTIAKAQLRLEKARRWPTLTPSVGVRRFEASNDLALVAGVTVPFQLFDRNQGQVASARASLARTRADAESERVRFHTTLFEVYEEMRHSIHHAEVLRDEVIPRFEATVVEMQQGYEKGRYSDFELREVEADLLEAKHSLVEASTAAHRHVITLERLTGERVAR